jgi:hypothetical protein
MFSSLLSRSQPEGILGDRILSIFYILQVAELVDELGGPSAVAEMTGRAARIVRINGKLTYCPRAKTDSTDMESLNIAVR